MRLLGTIVVSLLAAVSVATATSDDRSSEALEAVFQKTMFSLLYRRSELPESLDGFFRSRARDPSAPLADLLAEPGEDFNPGCLADHGVAPARLVFAGESENVSFALFERGGRSHYLVAVLLGSGNLAGRRCEYSLQLELLGLSDLKQRIHTSKGECT
jgi:hypothetical protein